MRFSFVCQYYCDGCGAVGQGVRRAAETYELAEVKGRVQPVGRKLIGRQVRAVADGILPEGWVIAEAKPSEVRPITRQQCSAFDVAGRVADVTGAPQDAALCPTCKVQAGIVPKVLEDGSTSEDGSEPPSESTQPKPDEAQAETNDALRPDPDAPVAAPTTSEVQ